jgi:hypothetical protein
MEQSFGIPLDPDGEAGSKTPRHRPRPPATRSTKPAPRRVARPEAHVQPAASVAGQRSAPQSTYRRPPPPPIAQPRNGRPIDALAPFVLPASIVAGVIALALYDRMFAAIGVAVLVFGAMTAQAPRARWLASALIGGIAVFGALVQLPAVVHCANCDVAGSSTATRVEALVGYMTVAGGSAFVAIFLLFAGAFVARRLHPGQAHPSSRV